MDTYNTDSLAYNTDSLAYFDQLRTQLIEATARISMLETENLKLKNWVESGRAYSGIVSKMLTYLDDRADINEHGNPDQFMQAHLELKDYMNKSVPELREKAPQDQLFTRIEQLEASIHETTARAERAEADYRDIADRLQRYRDSLFKANERAEKAEAESFTAGREHTAVCEKLREVIKRHDLGGLGQRLDSIVSDAIDQLTAENVQLKEEIKHWKEYDIVSIPGSKHGFRTVKKTDIQKQWDAAEDHLHNLLAVIHRDGGHYTDEHGLDKSATEASAKVSELLGIVDEHRVLTADNSRLRATCEMTVRFFPEGPLADIVRAALSTTPAQSVAAIRSETLHMALETLVDSVGATDYKFIIGHLRNLADSFEREAAND